MRRQAAGELVGCGKSQESEDRAAVGLARLASGPTVSPAREESQAMGLA